MTGAIIFLHQSLIVITSYFAITSFIHAVKLRKSKPKIKNSNSLVIRQKGKSQIGYFKKTKLAKFSEIRTFLTPICRRTCAYQGTHMYVCVSGDTKCSFFGKFGVLCFLEAPILTLALLPYYRRSAQRRDIHGLINFNQLYLQNHSQNWRETSSSYFSYIFCIFFI